MFYCRVNIFHLWKQSLEFIYIYIQENMDDKCLIMEVVTGIIENCSKSTKSNRSQRQLFEYNQYMNARGPF